MANVNETFRFIEYSNSDKFIKNNEGRIELKKYSEDLVLYSNFDGINKAIFGKGALIPTGSGEILNPNEGAFAQHVYLKNAYLRYDKSNFYNLTKEGSINFRVKTDFNNAKGSQSFKKTSNPIITSLPNVNKDIFHFGGGSLDLTGDEKKRVEYDARNIETMVQEGTIDFFIRTGYDGFPSKNIQILDIYNGLNDNNRITITHEIDGRIYFKIYNQIGTLIVDINFEWNADSSRFYNIQFNYNLNSGFNRVFINGTQYGITDNTIGTRTSLTTGYISLGSTLNDYISNFYIDDFAIFDRASNSINYRSRVNTFSETLDGLLLLNRYNLNLDLNVGTFPVLVGTIPIENDYRFRLRLDNSFVSINDISLDLISSDTLSTISNKINNSISSYLASSSIIDNKITITSDVNGALVEIFPPETGRSLLEILDGVDEARLENGPTNETVIFELHNQENSKDRITISHKTNSHIVVKMWDNSGILKVEQDVGVWNNWSHFWYKFELNWNNSIAQFFIDGKMVSVFTTNFERKDSGNFLTIRSGQDFYRFDELIVYNKYKHTTDHTIEEYELSPYDMSNPYIDIHFGSGFKENEVMGINVNSSAGIHFSVKIGNDWHYYFSGSWRKSDGSFSQTIPPSTLETKFHELFFDENIDLIIRAYFSSNGQTNQWIDELSIVIESNSDISAVITGEISLDGFFDLSSDQHVTIYTSQGSVEVDLTSQILGHPAEVIGTIDLINGYNWEIDPSEFAINGTVISLDVLTTNIQDILDLLNFQLPDGIHAKDDNGIIILYTDEISAQASIDISGSGLSYFGFIEDVYTGQDPDLTQVTANDIIDAINDANIPGLMPASLDSHNRLVLISRDRGEDAYIAISEGTTSNALDIIWGNASSDSGQQSIGPFMDYTVIKNWIREQLGAPIVPVELTEEQLENSISLAVNRFNYYRNYKESLIRVTLDGSAHEGYIIPQEVGGEENVIEIIVRPRFPFAYYTGGNADNIMSNVYMQWMFQRGKGSGFSSFVGDYYLTMSTQKDYSIIMGTQVSWRFYNNRIFISPSPVGMQIMIVFRSALTIEEINTNILIREYSLGEAKKTLGTIRSTFGGVIPGGGENINLNAEILKSEGKEEVESALEKMKGLMEPFGFDYG